MSGSRDRTDDAESSRDDEPRAYSARTMLDELTWPAGALRDSHARLETHFVAAVDPIIGLLMNACDKVERGEQGFAIRSLISRAINDLAVALHLITHGYLPQAYGAMRTAWEACDLIELLGQDVEQAKLWVNTTAGYRDFSPGKVRELLGKDRVDRFYSQLSEFNHPRFFGSRMSSYGVRKGGSDELDHVVVRLGPGFIDETADAWLAVGCLLTTLGLLGTRSSQLALHGAVTHAAWEDAMATSMTGSHALAELLSDALAEFGLDVEPVAELFKKAPSIVRDE